MVGSCRDVGWRRFHLNLDAPRRSVWGKAVSKSPVSSCFPYVANRPPISLRRLRQLHLFDLGKGCFSGVKKVGVAAVRSRVRMAIIFGVLAAGITYGSECIGYIDPLTAMGEGDPCFRPDAVAFDIDNEIPITARLIDDPLNDVIEFVDDFELVNSKSPKSISIVSISSRTSTRSA